MSVLSINKNLGMRQNVTIKVIDRNTGRTVSVHEGHNAATNSILTGIAHYLKGDGVLNQGYYMLGAYVPQYISLGTMGLLNQESDSEGYPAGIGSVDYTTMTYNDLSDEDLEILGKSKSSATVSAEDDEILRYTDYILGAPGYGADGYDINLNNGRQYYGLGPQFADRPDPSKTINCELISASFPRASISFRDVVPETEAELPQTIDVVFSAMVSTGALAQFRETGKDYVFITEAGLWSKPTWNNSGENGLLAGYRIAPVNEEDWDMRVEANRTKLKQQIIRVNINQVVQVIWKIQIGAIEQFGGAGSLYPIITPDGLKWINW